MQNSLHKNKWILSLLFLVIINIHSCFDVVTLSFTAEIYWSLADGASTEDRGRKHSRDAAVCCHGTEGSPDYPLFPGTDAECPEHPHPGQLCHAGNLGTFILMPTILNVLKTSFQKQESYLKLALGSTLGLLLCFDGVTEFLGSLRQ